MVHIDLHVLEETLHPEALHNLGKGLSRNRHLHSLLQTGKGYDLLGAELAVSLYRHPADYIFFRIVVIYRHILRGCRKGHEQRRKGRKDYPLDFHSHCFNVSNCKYRELFHFTIAAVAF